MEKTFTFTDKDLDTLYDTFLEAICSLEVKAEFGKSSFSRRTLPKVQALCNRLFPEENEGGEE